MKNIRSFLPLASIVMVLLFCSNASSEECYLYFYGEAARMFGSTPRGPYSESACENYRRNAPRLEKNNSECKCTNTSSGGYVQPSGGLSLSQQMAVGIFGAMLNSMFSNMFNDSTATSSAANARQEQLRIQQEQQQKKELQASLDKWNNALATAEKKALEVQERKKQRANAILTNEMGGGITGGGGKLDPMWITQKPEPNPIQLGKYPAPTSSFEQLKCASYFSDLAKKEKDKEGARFYSEQADKVVAGKNTDIPCQSFQTPKFPEPKPQQMEPEKFAAVMKDFDLRLKGLQDIKVKLDEARQEKQTAEENLKKIDEKITKLKNQAQSAQKPEEKDELDALVQQALAERSNAENQANTAKQNEQELLSQARDMEKDIKKDMDSKLKSSQQQEK